MTLSVNRHKLLEQCERVLPPNICKMIQTSLRRVIPKTVGNITNTTENSVCVVVQSSNCSPPLFNIFIDPLAMSLYEAIPKRDIPPNALLACDVTLTAKGTSANRSEL